MELLEVIYSMSALSIALFIAGFVLIIVEMFNPGFGVPGILGLIFLIAGILVTANALEQGLLM